MAECTLTVVPTLTAPAEVRSGRPRAIAAAVTAAVLVAVTVGFAVAADAGWPTLVDTYTLTNAVIGLGFLAPGAVIVWFRPANAVGGLLCWAGLGHLTTAAATMLAFLGLASGWPTVVLRTLSTVSTGAWQLGIPLLFPLALLLFPDGRLPSARWRPVAWLVVASGGYQLLSGVLSDGSGLGDDLPQLRSIVSVGLRVPEPVTVAAGLAFLVAFALVIAALVVRYVRGDERTRRQLLWLILALLAIVALNLQRWLTGEGPILLLLSIVLIPVAIGIGIVRYELLDIRLVLSRTLLYGLALSVIMAVYAGLVAGFSLLVPSRAERGVAIVAAIVVALIFTPVRLVLQRGLDRAFYGTRRDPAGTAGTIGERLRYDEELDGVLAQACEALRLPWLALRAASGGELAAVGTPDGGAVADVALRYRGEPVGVLSVGLRRGERELHPADRRTLDLVATPLAVALHATELRSQVQQARTATVEAGAAERVRLQRELHDGLGPALTSVIFQADAASNLVRSDVEGAGELLREMRADLRRALDDLRQVVYGLRPIELDDLGLVGALREKAAALEAGAGRSLAVELAAPERLGEVSPAVELAAYRVVSEALTNVVRHSTAHHCVIGLAVEDDLLVTVTDDGAAPAGWRPGVGLHSIAERAEELGGSASCGPSPAGWTVAVRLPLRSVVSSG